MQIGSRKISVKQWIKSLIGITLGSLLAALALEIFLIPNDIIDGGVIGLAILWGRYFGQGMFYPLVLILNLPFIYLAFSRIAKSFVVKMLIAVFTFIGFGLWMDQLTDLAMLKPYQGDLLEIVVMGGVLLGLGVGLIIRFGGCLDGTEIMGILLNKRYGVTVGNVVLASNSIIFLLAGFVYQDWHPPIKSLITFFIVMKIMDMVITGFEEMKSITIITSAPKEVGDALVHELGLGLSFLQAKGGYSQENREILYLIAERLQLSTIKDQVYAIDPRAFIAIQNLHEVASLNEISISHKGQKVRT